MPRRLPRHGTARACSAARHGRDHRDLDAGRHLGVEPLGQPHVLLADVDVDEPAELAALEDAFLELGKLRAEVAEDLADRVWRGPEWLRPAVGGGSAGS